MRFVLSLLILTALITYLAIPAMKRIRRFGKAEAKRINDAFDDDEQKPKFRGK